MANRLPYCRPDCCRRCYDNSDYYERGSSRYRNLHHLCMRNHCLSDRLCHHQLWCQQPGWPASTPQPKIAN